MSDDDLASRDCIPCRGGIPPLGADAIAELMDRLGGGWSVVDAHHLQKTYRFPDFASALRFTNRLGELAEAQDHHPEIHLGWGRVRVEIWTHKIDGLTDSDFVLAAKMDVLDRT